MSNLPSDSTSTGVVAVVTSERFLAKMLLSAHKLASNRGEALTILLLTDDGARPAWFAVPDTIDASQYVLEIPPAGPRRRQVTRWLRDHEPALMAFAFDANDGDERRLLNRELDHVLLKIRCPVALFNPGRDFRIVEGRNVRNMVHFTRDASSRFAVEAALQLNPDVELTVVATGPAPMDDEDRAAHESEFRRSLGELADHPRLKTLLLLGDDAVDRLLDEARKHDRVLFGMGRGDTLLPPVTREERVEIYKEIRRAARPTRIRAACSRFVAPSWPSAC